MEVDKNKEELRQMEEENEQKRRMLQDDGKKSPSPDGKKSKTSPKNGAKGAKSDKLDKLLNDEEALKRIDAEVMKRLEQGEDAWFGLHLKI